MSTPVCFEDKDTRKIIEDLCRSNKIDLQLLVELSELVQKYSGSGRKEGFPSEVSACIDAFLEREAAT